MWMITDITAFSNHHLPFNHISGENPSVARPQNGGIRLRGADVVYAGLLVTDRGVGMMILPWSSGERESTFAQTHKEHMISFRHCIIYDC